MTSWLVHSTLNQALAGNAVLCCWAKHFTLTMPLSTQVYKWVPANLILGVTLQWNSIPSRRTRNIRSRFMLLKPSYAPAWWATWLVCRLTLPTIISIPEMDTKTFIFARKGWKRLQPYLKAQKSQFLGNRLSVSLTITTKHVTHTVLERGILMGIEIWIKWEISPELKLPRV